jgi:hypothetical protein
VQLAFVCLQPENKTASAREVRLDQPLSLADRQLIVQRALNTDQQDAEDYLERSRARYDRCGFLSAL